MILAASLARASVRLTARPGVSHIRNLHRTPVALKKKKPAAAAEDPFENEAEEQWGGEVEDLFSSGPSKPKSTVVKSIPVATSSATTTEYRGLTPAEREARFQKLYKFVEARIGPKPSVTSSKARRSVFPQLIQLSTTPEHLQSIVALMHPWKNSSLGTQGKARLGADGKPKGVHPYDDATSEHFARRCEELKVPELALKVFGDYSQHGLKLTVPAGRRILHGLVVNERPFEDVITATALYEVYSLPPVHEDLPSSALLLSACLRHLKTAEGAQKRKTQALVNGLLASLEQSLKATPPMAASRDIRDKTIRKWLKSAMLDLSAFLQEKGQAKSWLERWMVQSRFLPVAN
ncbi:unnamed protein product [Mycena citricolor]|uniref:Uncharacterized protein n=1 Tax=Mycena citricolor TaxID=2018698 RepID=A0AAD2GUX5_9AGAR|nr:unnamed protein product [Mycena citricolor]